MARARRKLPEPRPVRRGTPDAAHHAERVRSLRDYPQPGRPRRTSQLSECPLFAVRGRDQRARVFRNACRHRGFALVEGAGCSHALVCRYHGWTYRLDGSLSHVPHADAFPDLDLSTRGLVEVDQPRGGRAHRHRRTRPSRRPSADEAMRLADRRDSVAGQASCRRSGSCLWSPFSRAMNWKVLVEQFLEGYHIRSTHKDTFYPAAIRRPQRGRDVRPE